MSDSRVASRPKPFGRYVLLERVAIGGMAEIFLAAEEQSYGGWRFVTIKRIRPDCDDIDYRDFFMTEARVALQCCHPNVPQVYEVGEVDGSLFLAMEFIRGHTLLSYLQAINRVGLRSPVPVATNIAAAVAAALEHIHDLRNPEGCTLDVIHRDVTPQNVMVSQAGAVKLIDFGIVRSAIQIHKTQAGVVKGKFAYMAPETLEAPQAVDARADLFAVGVMIHELLSGRPLFRARNEAETMERVRHMPIPALSKLRRDVPPEIERVVARCLARDPAKRYGSATELLSAIEAAAASASIPTSTVGLRQTVTAACGEPPLPVFDGNLYSVAGEGHVSRVALGSDSESTQIPTVRPRAASSRAKTASEDDELRYFLSRGEVDSAYVRSEFDLLDED